MTLTTARLRRLSATRERADRNWREAICEAVAAGESLRAVGAAAGISHVRVLQIVREEEAAQASTP